MSSVGYLRYEIIESVIMEFKNIFFGQKRGSEISLWSYIDEIVHIHTDPPCRRESTGRIIWLIDESHLFELFHVIANSSWREIHRFRAYE